MKPLFILVKSMVAGYTRKDGAYVKPHADKRVKRAPLEPHQLVLFPKPAAKPITPNPFKGLDPVKSTGDLFEDDDEDEEKKKKRLELERAAAAAQS